jgi:hypothetical protein
MSWPFDKRVEPTHAWGVIGAGLAVDAAIVGALASLNASKPDFKWYWPTNGMIAGAVLVVIGLALLFIPVRRSPTVVPVTPSPPVHPPTKIFTGTLEEAEKANERTAEAVKNYMAEGIPPPSPGPSDVPHG